MKAWSPASQCHGKTPFATAGEARCAAKRATLGGTKVTAYECPHCSTPTARRWHIDHAVSKKMLRASRRRKAKT